MLKLDLPATRAVEDELESELLDIEEVEEVEEDEDFDDAIDDNLELLILEAEDAELDLETLEPEFNTNSEISRYLHDINKFPRLSQEEEVELAKLIKAAKESTDPAIVFDGKQARDKFINSNYKLVVAIAKMYRHSCNGSITFFDLIQSGNLGLMHAVDRFDYTKGWKFSTYATWWIKQRIRRDIQDVGQAIRVPVHVQDWLSKIHKLELAANRQLTVDELADATGLTTAKVEKFLRIRAEMPMIYLDKIVNTEDSEASLLDVIASDIDSPEDIYKKQATEDRLREIMINRLTDRELYILSRRFGLINEKAVTLETIAMELGVTRERIRQIEAIALRKLRSDKIQRELKAMLKLR